MKRTLDLGCGTKISNPFNADEVFGVDIREDLGSNIKSADLTTGAIPYQDNFFDYVTAFDFIEHIPRVIYAPNRRNSFVELMNEVYRVLKNGGFFLSLTPAYPNGVAFRDPTHVNIITDETLTLYFDDTNRWASIYGFNGAFKIIQHEWRGPHIFAILQKVPVHETKISVVIPVYNGEAYIEETLKSALQQTLRDFEIICIDDCSSDNSLTIIEKISQQDERVKIFRTPANLGCAAKSINYILDFCQGEYFVYASQDDLFSEDWLENMYTKAVGSDADAVIPDLVFYYENHQEKCRMLSGLYGDRSLELSGKEACIFSLDWHIPGNALWKMGMIRRYKFEDFGVNSDEFSVRKFFLNSKKVVFSRGVFYYRQDNQSAVTKKITYRTFDYPYTQYRLYQLAREHGLSGEIIQKEALKAVKLTVDLKNWFEENQAQLTEKDISEIKKRITKIVGCLENDAMFEAVFAMGIMKKLAEN